MQLKTTTAAKEVRELSRAQTLAKQWKQKALMTIVE